ncbi:TRL domain-containing protein [Verrucomicrobiota bacterium]
MKKLTWLILFAVVLGICGCMSAPFSPPPGMLVTSIKAPLTVDFESTPVCEKNGKATASYCMIPCYGPLLSFAWDDCCLEAAKMNGNLSEIEYADYELLNILGVWQKTTVTAYGK